MKVKDVIAAYQKLDLEREIWVCVDCGHEIVPPLPGNVEEPDRCTKKEAAMFKANGHKAVSAGDYMIFVGMN